MTNIVTKLEGSVLNTITGKQVRVGDTIDSRDVLLVQSGTITINAEGKDFTFNQGSIIDITSTLFNDKAAEIEIDRIEQLVAEGKDIAVAINSINDADSADVGEIQDEGTSTPLVIDFDNTQGLVTSGYPTGPISLVFEQTIEDIVLFPNDNVVKNVEIINPILVTDEPPVLPPVEPPVLPPVEPPPVEPPPVEPPPVEPPPVEPPPVEPPPVEPPDDDDDDDSEDKEHQDNGFGNGDDDAPGGSGPHNNAENAGDTDADPEDYPGNSNHGNQNITIDDVLDTGNNDVIPKGGPKGNNGFGNGDQDAPGGSGPNNNAENAGGTSADPSTYPGNSSHLLDSLIEHGNPHG